MTPIRLLLPLSLALAVTSAGAAPTTRHTTRTVHAAPAKHIAAKSVLPFIEDDYPKALAEARARNLPLFMDVWAPWCHSCVSLQAYVYTDPALAPFAKQFVWLELDSEKAKSAPILKKFPVEALPTLFVVNPKDESVAVRWVGSGTVAQVSKMLDDGAAVVAGGATAGGPDAALARADRAYGEGHNAEAARAYLDALAAAPEGWPRYARTVESALFALSQSDSNEVAATLARDAYPKLGHTASAANVAGTGLDCAIAIPAERPGRQALIDALEVDTKAVVADATLPIAADDRSGAYIALLDARQDAKDEAGAKAVATEWAAFLDQAAAAAKTPEARAVFDSHRLSAAIELGTPERAIPFLEQSEKDFPADYNPPARLASAYKAMKQWTPALAASDRALARAYGPRKLLVLQTRADIYTGLGDPVAARRTLEEAVATAEAFPPGQRSERTIAGLKKKIEALASNAK